MKISVKLGNVKEAITVLQKYRDSLPEKNKTFLARLAELGMDTASVSFSHAQYDGTNDVAVSIRWEDDGKVLVVARGRAVTFIEFGTGVVYADDHPKAAEMGAVRGGYGEGHGVQRTWGYYGDPGTNGVSVAKERRDDLVLTHGNPASRSMYEAGKAMRERIMEIAKEVYGT